MMPSGRPRIPPFGLASRERRETSVALTSRPHWFETEEQLVYNGHFESVCDHPLFVFNQDGDCLAAKLSYGGIQHRDGRRDVCAQPIRGDPGGGRATSGNAAWPAQVGERRRGVLDWKLAKCPTGAAGDLKEGRRRTVAPFGKQV
jgi:hypothetical protein